MISNTSQINLPRAILFDFDGVIVGSEPIHWNAWQRLLRKIGIPYIEDEIKGLVGKTAPQILTAILKIHRPDHSFSANDIEELSLEKNNFYLEETMKGMPVYPGVIELLIWLKEKGIPRIIVSNARKRELLQTTRQSGIDQYFSELLSRDDCNAAKPDPIPYLLGAKRAGFPGNQCLAVEDSPPGIASALLANIPAAAVLTNFSRTSMETPIYDRPDLHPIWIGQGIKDLFAWLKSLPE